MASAGSWEGKEGLEGRLAEGWSWLEGKVGQGLCSCSELRAALFRFSPHPFLAKCQRKYENLNTNHVGHIGQSLEKKTKKLDPVG